MADEPFDPYAVLGIARSASADEIHAAWRKCAQAAHPDREGGSAERMSQVNQAYQILSDPERRSRYDAGLGTDKPIDVERRAKDFILGLVGVVVRQAPANANMVVLIMNGIANQKASLKDSRCKTLAEIEGLRQRARRLKGPPENFIQDLLKAEIARGERLLRTYDLDEVVMAKALEILRDFSYEEEMFRPLGTLLGANGQPLLMGYHGP